MDLDTSAHFNSSGYTSPNNLKKSNAKEYEWLPAPPSLTASMSNMGCDAPTFVHS
jgi:hypothetical protein